MDIITFIQTAQYNLPLYLGAFLLYIAIIWLAVVVWVWSDVRSRTHSLLVQLAAVLFTLLGNLMGLVIYLLLRPPHTLEDRESHSLFHASILDKDINSCPHCGFLVRTEFKHCPNCQYNLEILCKKCDSRLNPSWNYCVTCGERQYPETLQERTTKMIRSLFAGIVKAPTAVVNVGKRGWRAYLNFVANKITLPTRNYLQTRKEKSLAAKEAKKAAQAKKKADKLQKKTSTKKDKKSKKKKSRK